MRYCRSMRVIKESVDCQNYSFIYFEKGQQKCANDSRKTKQSTLLETTGKIHMLLIEPHALTPSGAFMCI